jgi:hypothetical protein
MAHHGPCKGILGDEHKDPTAHGQLCAWLTKKGQPCGNPANYRVEGRVSCSRDHRP